MLQPTDGNLPQTEPQLVALLERIRRQGHIHEGALRHPTQQAGVGDPGSYHFYPTFNNDTSATGHTPPDVSGHVGGGLSGDPWANASFPTGAAASSSAEDMGSYVGGSFNSARWEAEDRCVSYFEDEEFSSATETDEGSADEGILEYNTVYVDGQARNDNNARENELYQDYLLARRRWRRFTGKPPRRYRRSNFRASRNVGRLRNGPYAKTYASFLPPSAFAGGKGGLKSKGSGKGGSRKNPRGRDGQVLRCSKCGSDEHLWRKCPQVASKGNGKGTGAMHATEGTRSGPSALALTTSSANPQAEMWHTSAAASAMPGVAFHYHMGAPRTPSQAMSSAGSQKAMTALDEDLAKLESISQVSSQRSRKSRRSEITPDSPPGWHAGEDRGDAPSEAASASTGPRVEALQVGAPVPKHPPPSRRGPGAEELERQKTVLQLNSLLMAWWEGSEGTSPAASSNCVEGALNESKAYHLRTRLPEDRPGLLVDPGAHDNLIGDRTASRMEEIVGVPAKQLRMNKALNVEGVGKNPQSAAVAKRLTVRLGNDEGGVASGSFTAPVISDSDLPPLLGLRSLKSFRCILDIGNNKLILPGPAGCEVQRCPGTVAYDLTMSDSGHLILPVDAQTDAHSKTVSQSSERLDFQMSCRQGSRSISPKRPTA